MFTGIIQEVGIVRKAEKKGKELHLLIEAPRTAKRSKPGDSVAVNGCCLTVVRRRGSRMEFQAVGETLKRTLLGSLKEKDGINLETPLTLSEPLGGHLVQGHVDGVGKVLEMKRLGEGAVLRVEVPGGLERYVVEKGSIALDGVSLTVAGIRGREVEVALIPHTLNHTAFKQRKAGDGLHVEADLVAKHLEKLSVEYRRKGKRTP